MLASQVAEQLMAHDALAAHARDELGISETQAPRPVLAARRDEIDGSGDLLGSPIYGTDGSNRKTVWPLGVRD